MEKIKLKNCPNCNERIGGQDIECPYCKYIDDPKYKKHNQKLVKKKKKVNKKPNIYKIFLSIPIVFYLIYLIFDISLLYIVIPLILLNIVCLFTKKTWVVGVSLIEIIALTINLISNIYQMFTINSFKEVPLIIVIFILGIFFLIMPKLMYLIKSKRKKKY